MINRQTLWKSTAGITLAGIILGGIERAWRCLLGAVLQRRQQRAWGNIAQMVSE